MDQELRQARKEETELPRRENQTGQEVTKVGMPPTKILPCANLVQEKASGQDQFKLKRAQSPTSFGSKI